MPAATYAERLRRTRPACWNAAARPGEPPDGASRQRHIFQGQPADWRRAHCLDALLARRLLQLGAIQPDTVLPRPAIRGDADAAPMDHGATRSRQRNAPLQPSPAKRRRNDLQAGESEKDGQQPVIPTSGLAGTWALPRRAAGWGLIGPCRLDEGTGPRSNAVHGARQQRQEDSLSSAVPAPSQAVYGGPGGIRSRPTPSPSAASHINLPAPHR